MGKSAFKPGNMLYPLPAVMVSCQYPGTSDPECSNPALSGRPNILTVAWAGTVCTNPPMLSISVRPERYSYHMIETAGEFVVNLTTEALVRATDYCGVRSGRDVDKFKEMHLTPLASREVSVPRHCRESRQYRMPCAPDHAARQPQSDPCGCRRCHHRRRVYGRSRQIPLKRHRADHLLARRVFSSREKARHIRLQRPERHPGQKK